MFEKILKWYSMSLWTAEMVQSAVTKGVITEEQCNKILKTK